MFQYLLNMTAIWTLSLLLFDAFLRKESFHGYNRAYLLFTMLTGALLPLVQFKNTTTFYPDTIQKPVAQVIAAKQNIIAATTPVSSMTTERWLLALYITGACVAMGLLIRDIAKLVVLSRSGKKSKKNGWTVIETGKEHTPFSFRNMLFVNNIDQYGSEEWNIIQEHEAQHNKLLHLADVLLLQVCKIIFWFHPLSYIYAKRLLLVHEYQADHFARQQPQSYGKFLIEQALLSPAPTMSHSFNRSPIKKRILMLTRSSSSIAKSKMLVLVPLALACVLCFSKNSFSQNAKDKYPIVSAFGTTNERVKEAKHTTYDKVLSSPKLTCKELNCEVIGYDFSIVPKGKDYRGPYAVTGSTLPQMPLGWIKECKDSAYSKTRIFIENIRVMHNGKEEKTSPLILICEPS